MIKTNIPKINGREVHTYTITTSDQTVLTIIFQEPTFDLMIIALNELYTLTGSLNLAGSGKKLFDTCCLEHSKNIEKYKQDMMSFFIELSSEYALPAANEIKKN